MSQKVKVEVTDKDAIYVNGTRVTDRSTKWGSHIVIDTFDCERKDVDAECRARGYTAAADKIDFL